jgi:hypothetical protein
LVIGKSPFIEGNDPIGDLVGGAVADTVSLSFAVWSPRAIGPLGASRKRNAGHAVG